MADSGVTRSPMGRSTSNRTVTSCPAIEPDLVYLELAMAIVQQQRAVETIGWISGIRRNTALEPAARIDAQTPKQTRLRQFAGILRLPPAKQAGDAAATTPQAQAQLSLGLSPGGHYCGPVQRLGIHLPCLPDPRRRGRRNRKGGAGGH